MFDPSTLTIILYLCDGRVIELPLATDGMLAAASSACRFPELCRVAVRFD